LASLRFRRWRRRFAMLFTPQRKSAYGHYRFRARAATGGHDFQSCR